MRTQRSINLVAAVILTNLLLISSAIAQQTADFTKFYSERFVPAALEQIHAAQLTYSGTVGSGSYGSLSQLQSSGLIDESLGSGTKFGYRFVVNITGSIFYVSATPNRYRKTGVRSYLMDVWGDLRGADKGGDPATTSDGYLDHCSIWGITRTERCAIRSLRKLAAAEVAYASTVGNGNFAIFPDLVNTGLVSPFTGSGVTYRYIFSVTYTASTQQAPATFALRAKPLSYGTSGVRSFYLDQTGVLRGGDKNGSDANAFDPIIED